MEGHIKKRFAAVGILFLATLAIWTEGFLEPFDIELKAEVLQSSKCPKNLLCVAFLDVGQGDAIFIQSPSGEQMLIDGGRDSSVLRQLPKVMGVTDRDLDYVLITHPDADHVGGLVEIIKRYQIDNIIRTENESDTDVWQTLEDLIEQENTKLYTARRGQRYDLGKGVVFEVLFPDVDAGDMESNTSSIVGKLIYGETSFMFTGDSPKGIEEYLVLVDGEYLKSDVLKAGHHGSRTSTSELFLNEVRPTYAVISAGKDNQYGHPHVEVTDMLFNVGVNTLSTAEEGNIVFVSDGSTVDLK